MGRILTTLIIAACLFFGWKQFTKSDTAPPADASAGMSSAELARLAATVKAGGVVMYSTTECQYCAQAKSWLNQYGFAFTECNMSVRPECDQEFKSYGASGTPFLVVRGQQMRDGFDSDQFISFLKKT